MQDSGHNGRDAKGRFQKGAIANPNGRAGKPAQPDFADVSLPLAPRYDAVPDYEQIDPTKAMNIVRIDGWQNASTGFGVPGKDKRLGGQFTSDVVTYRDAIELWRGDDIAARAITVLPQEALKKGYELTITDEGDFEDLKEQVENLFDDLSALEMLRTSLQFERAYGGGALMIGANDGQDMSMPLNMDTICDFPWLTPLEPIELFPLKCYDNPQDRKYGKPELYQLSAIASGPAMGMGDPMQRVMPSTTVIHESRLIIFPGERVSKFQNKTSVGGLQWGDSVLTRMQHVLRDFNMAYSSAAIIMTEQGLPVFGMKELAKLVNNNRMDIVQARLSLLFQQMSTARAAVIDSEETYERKAMPLTGISDILDRFGSRMAAAVNMPITKLLGQSPKGLGNEGDSDMGFWYDNVETYQKDKVRRPLRTLLQIAMRACRVAEPQKWSIKFHPLQQQSDKEVADARSTQATTDVAYITAGVVSAEDIRRSRFSGDYSFETQVDFESYEALDQVAAQPLAPEDLMAMGLDPNDPNAMAQAQQMQAQEAQSQGISPGHVDPSALAPDMPPGAEGETAPGEEAPNPDAPNPDEVDSPKAAALAAAQGGEAPAPEGEAPVEGDEQKPAPFGKKPAAPGVAEGEHAPPAHDPDAPAEEAPPADDAPPADAEQPPEGEQPADDGGAPDQDSTKEATGEGEPAPAEHAGGRHAHTEEDRQRMASSMPGVTHLADRNGDGRVTPQEASGTIEDLLARIQELKAIMKGGQPVPVEDDAAPTEEAPTDDARPTEDDSEEKKK